jgi:Carbohydrate family 9 binding domain-like
MRRWRLLFIAGLALMAGQKQDPYNYPIRVPRLERTPAIDGDLSEWKYVAFTDGMWDILRLSQAPWYDPSINRLTDHGHEPPPEDDLQARYYTAWDEKYLYLGAEVKDNVNDVTDPQHEPKRWYYKDAICWFIEAPREDTAKKFGVGDNAFCFVIDARKPPYGAWWRHGAEGKTYIEELLPRDAVDYAIRMNPWDRSKADFILEARVAMAPTLGKSSPRWHAPRIGDVYGLEIVHTDPDGGDYGGHFLIYGRGDDDSTWGRMELTGPIQPIERKPK